jgi:hypothetical protein
VNGRKLISGEAVLDGNLRKGRKNSIFRGSVLAGNLRMGGKLVSQKNSARNLRMEENFTRLRRCTAEIYMGVIGHSLKSS